MKEQRKLTSADWNDLHRAERLMRDLGGLNLMQWKIGDHWVAGSDEAYEEFKKWEKALIHLGEHWEDPSDMRIIPKRTIDLCLEKWRAFKDAGFDNPSDKT